jgi:hypothetical protein
MPKLANFLSLDFGAIMGPFCFTLAFNLLFPSIVVSLVYEKEVVFLFNFLELKSANYARLTLNCSDETSNYDENDGSWYRSVLDDKLFVLVHHILNIYHHLHCSWFCRVSSLWIQTGDVHSTSLWARSLPFKPLFWILAPEQLK